MSVAERIAQRYNNGKSVKNGNGGFITCCPTHDDKNPSLSIWDDDTGSVRVNCHAGCGWKEIQDQFRKDGLLPEWKPEKKRNGAKSKVGLPPAPKEPEPPEKQSYRWKISKRENLEHIEKYLSNRAIKIDPLPVCFRWGEYEDQETKEKHEIIVAAASKPTDKMIYAIQRLFIDTDNHTKIREGMLGPCNGRGVWFDRKENVAEIIVGEGIENSLSVMQATAKNGVATLSVAGMKSLIIPDETKTIYIAVDSDPVREKDKESMPGQKAAYALAESFGNSRDDRKAYLLLPDDTCFSDNPKKLDFNDLLKNDPTGETIRERFAKAIQFEDLKWQPPASAEKVSGSSGSSGSSEFYPEDTLEALQKMNEKYAAVLLGGDFRIAKEGFDHAARKHTLSFLKTTSLFMYYANTRVRVPVGPEGAIEYKELAKVWIGWEGRRTYDDVVFDPSEKNRPNVYNLFKGFPLKPKQGDWSLMRRHIFEVICDGNAEHFNYVMSWMARTVQDPGGDKPGVAIVLKGGKGIGKGVFVNYFGSIFGEAFLPISDSDSFTGRFNMHLSKSLVVFLDEAVWGGDKKAEGKLKSLITEPTILFEPKGIDSIALSNYINIIIASNEEWVVPATGDERRYCVLEPSEDFKQNTEYFGKIALERNNGGAEAMMYDLMRYEYSGVDLRRAPLTIGLSQQVQESLSSVLEFWHSVINREFLLSDRETGKPKKSEFDEAIAPINELWPGAVFKHEIYAEFIQWCKIKNERYIKNETHFWRNTRSIWPGGTPVEKRSSERVGRVRFYLLPELEEFKASFSQKTNIFFDEQTEDHDETVPFNNQF